MSDVVRDVVRDEYCFNINRAICQLYHGENKLIFNKMTIMYVLFCRQISV